MTYEGSLNLNTIEQIEPFPLRCYTCLREIFIVLTSLPSYRKASFEIEDNVSEEG